jgi:hypothetical protein
LPTVDLGTPGVLRNPFGPVTCWDPAASRGPGTLGPRKPWGPKTSGSLETFGCPISLGGLKSPRILSILKHNCHLIAIWALLHFPGPYNTFQDSSGAHHSASPGPLLMRVIWSFRAPLEPSGAPGPINLLPLLPPLQATAHDLYPSSPLPVVTSTPRDL